MMDALQRRDLAEIFSQIGNVFEQVLPPGSEIFAIRDRLLTLGAGTACMSGSGLRRGGFFFSGGSCPVIRSGYDRGPLCPLCGAGVIFPSTARYFFRHFPDIFPDIFLDIYRTSRGQKGRKKRS